MTDRQHATAPCSPIESIDKAAGVTVGIEVSSTAPAALLDRVLAMAHELGDLGIEVTVDQIRTCRVCGCTDDRACLGGCWWVDEQDDICSTCSTNGATARGAEGHVWPCPLFYTGNWSPTGIPQRQCTAPTVCHGPDAHAHGNRSDGHQAAGQPQEGEPS